MMFLRRFFSRLHSAFILSALPITLFGVLPTVAKPTHFSSHREDRTAVVLFRSYGDLPQFSGFDVLNQKLENQFGRDPHIPFSSRVFKQSELEDAFNYVNSFHDLKHLVIVGYSFGGTSAFELATKLQPNKVDEVIEVDAVPRPSLDQPVSVSLLKQLFPNLGFPDVNVDELVGNREFVTFVESDQLYLGLLKTAGFTGFNQAFDDRAAVELLGKLYEVTDLSKPPNNVIKGINYFQISREPEEQFESQGITNIPGFENINVEELFRDETITHSSIQGLSLLHERIVDDIANVRSNVNAQPFQSHHHVSGILVYCGRHRECPQ